MYQVKKVCRGCFVFLSICLFLPGLSPADCFTTTWPHEKSALQADPSIVYGRLENGFRYILQKNSVPKHRVAMSLDIQAGSLHEDDDQRGIAHFLEHMLFNGSTHFAPGELIEYFQSIGMNFGGDTNAHTSYDETVYEILLPGGSKEEIEKGLLVFEDYARGALLLQSEIDRERGVILAEKRSRDSAAYRARMKELAFSMDGSRIPERVIIGIIETLNKADHAVLKRYYDAWYRPENMVLVMVGDFDMALVQTLIEKQFGQLQAEGEKPDCPDYGRIRETSGASFFYHSETEMGHTETAIETHWNTSPEDDSRELQKRELRRYLAVMIVQHRLDALTQKKDTPFTTAHIYSGTFLGRFAYAEINAACDPEKWEQSLMMIENKLRQALQYGFSEAEVERVKKELLAELDSAILTKNSRNSKKLAAEIIRTLNRNRVMLSPEQEKDFFAPVIAKITRAGVEQAFADIWFHNNRLVKINGNLHLEGEEPLLQIRRVYDNAVQRRVTSFEETASIAFPYLHFDSPAKESVLTVETFESTDSRRMILANGVVVNFKQTDFQENAIKVVASFGTGKAEMEFPGLYLLADAVIPGSGTGRLTRDDLTKILSGTSIKSHFSVGETAFQYQFSSLSKDIELVFQVLQSLLADPGVDEDAFSVGMDRLKQYYDSMQSDIRGAMQLYGKQFLADGNPFFGLPAWSDFSQLGLKQVKDWYVPAAKYGNLEISLVGDFDPEQVQNLVKQYFSVLPKRLQQKEKQSQVSFPAGKKLNLTTHSSIEKGMLVVAWKTDDYWNINRTRGLHVLAEIFSEKLRQEVREKLGAVYSPQVYNVSSRIYKGYGVIQAVLTVDPSQIEILRKTVLEIADILFRGEISETELQHAKGPVMTSLKDMIRTNHYWLTSVLDQSSRYPEQLQWPNSILSVFGSFSVSDMKAFAKGYLGVEKAAVITIVPE